MKDDIHSSKANKLTMRKDNYEEEDDIELLKAVAQAWHAQSGNPKPTNELDAVRRRRFERRPSRFKLEAASVAAKENSHWDFSQSLWDSYEIVTLSKKLEASMAFDHPMSTTPESCSGRRRRRRESKNSLRNFLSRHFSKRVDGDAAIGGERIRDEG